MVGFGVEMVRAGDRLGQRYQVVEQIAAGGMGTLWRAHHIELDVDVALKVVSARASTPASIKRFKREAQAAAKLRSPNIVQVLDYGEFDGQPYLAMELLRGEDLAARIASRGKVPLHECARILDGVAKGVQLAHDAGIVHRDLKPGNIFLERIGDDEVVKLLDFGIAKDLSAVADPASTTGSGVVGSPAYMSPEQVWAKKVGSRSDVWAMGVVTFEMLTGKNPFMAETLAKIFERIIREPLPKLGEFEPGLPAALGVFFERALSRSVAERIPSARDFAEQFRGAIDGREPPPAPRFDVHATTEKAIDGPRTADTLRRRDHVKPRARRRAVILLGVAGATAVAIALFAMPRAREPRQSEHPHASAVLAQGPAVPAAEVPPKPAVQIAIPTASPEPSSAPPPTPTASVKRVGSRKPATTGAPVRKAATASSAIPELDPKFGIPVSR